MMTELSTAEITAAQAALKGVAIQTPTLGMESDRWRGLLPEIASGTIKMELFQQVGSFKARGAYLGVSGLSNAEILS